MNRANAISLRGLGDCTAEALRTLSKEFLIKKYSELGALCAFVVNPTFLIFGCGFAALCLCGEKEFGYLTAEASLPGGGQARRKSNGFFRLTKSRVISEG